MAETTAGRLVHNLVERQETINRELARNGVRFGIYRDGTYHDRLFPYDPVPRLIPSDEFDRLEAGLKQRVSALNAFLRDVYSDKRIVRDGVVPEEFVYTSRGYLPQVNGMTPPAGIYAHVAGEDLVQGEDGSWWVLEDNLRIPRVRATPSSCATSSATQTHASFTRTGFATTATTPDSCATSWTSSPRAAWPWCSRRAATTRPSSSTPTSPRRPGPPLPSRHGDGGFVTAPSPWHMRAA